MLSSSAVTAQKTHEYIGVITLTDSSFISYKLSFEETNGFIKGYSVTDLSGPHETKSMITGTYDDKEKQLKFRESGIVYTKSPITQNDFCYIHFEGRLAKLNDRRKLSGTFVGKFDDGVSCIDGEIEMKSLVKVEKKARRLDNTVDKSILVSQEKKDAVNLVRTLDSLNTNFLNANERLQVFSRDDVVTLTVVDVGQEDGDKITIYADDKVLLRDAAIGLKPQSFKIKLSSQPVELRVEATSAGTIGANTIQLNLTDSINQIEAITNMKKGEKATLLLIKQ
ncbi:hypothetical protein [Gilvibacter sediminis]|uniref:hypothetical protein n=1 Tax=Gilvibacter sediminis TaxID=379071 RepID=UPI002350A458|nr:hypothetical protein [Gilvibacter sediminis]MDC7997171.1 hypothetical protein [Gilvibacter sediminis]